MPLFFLALAGLILGSFGNVLIARLPSGESISGRSRCLGCRQTIGVRDLIPVVSFLLLQGRCRTCHMRISLRYPLVELTSTVLWVFAFFLAPTIATAIALGVAFWAMLLIVVIDARLQVIPDLLSITLFIAATTFHLLHGGIPLLAPVIAGGFFAMQWIASRGRWVGSGDILLSAGLGMLLGTWQQVVLSLMLSYILGAIVATMLLLTKKKSRAESIAFGPFLIVGAGVVLVWGEMIVEGLL